MKEKEANSFSNYDKHKVIGNTITPLGFQKFRSMALMMPKNSKYFIIHSLFLLCFKMWDMRNYVMENVSVCCPLTLSSEFPMHETHTCLPKSTNYEED